MILHLHVHGFGTLLPYKRENLVRIVCLALDFVITGLTFAGLFNDVKWLNITYDCLDESVWLPVTHAIEMVSFHFINASVELGRCGWFVCSPLGLTLPLLLLCTTRSYRGFPSSVMVLTDHSALVIKCWILTYCIILAPL